VTGPTADGRLDVILDIDSPLVVPSCRAAGEPRRPASTEVSELAMISPLRILLVEDDRVEADLIRPRFRCSRTSADRAGRTARTPAARVELGGDSGAYADINHHLDGSTLLLVRPGSRRLAPVVVDASDLERGLGDQMSVHDRGSSRAMPTWARRVARS